MNLDELADFHEFSEIPFKAEVGVLPADVAYILTAGTEQLDTLSPRPKFR
jgi:hypothetical protein